MKYLGDFKEDATVYVMFNTFTSDDPSASSTITNFANTDVHIHKDDSDAQRNNAAGITVSIDFDGITGSHMIKIDTSDDTVGAFWVVAHDYFVRIEGVTVDGATINAVVAHFSIENRNNQVDVTHLLGTAWLTPGVAGTPDVNTKTITNDAITAAAIKAAAIDNATFAADVGSTAHGTNIIALAVRKILEELNLDHLLKVTTGVAADADLEDYVVAGTVMAHALSTGADVTTFKPSTDSLEAIKVHADTIKAETALIVEDTGTTLDTLIKDIPTVAEFEARSLVTADYTIVSDLPSEPPTTAQIKTAMEVDGSKLDHIWETTEDDTGVRRFTANALEEAPTGSGSGLDAAGVRTAIGMAAANLDTQIGTVDTVVDAIKLKTDTLGGAGAITWTYTITDSGTGLPIADADIWITLDEAGTNVIASGKTDASGVATFYMDEGTIYVWRQKSGYNFVNPDSEEVTA